MGRILIRGIAPVGSAQIFSTTRIPFGAASDVGAVEGQADLIDDAGQAEQVLGSATGHSDRPGSSRGRRTRSHPSRRFGPGAARGGPPGREEPALAPDASESADPSLLASHAGMVVISVPGSTRNVNGLPGALVGLHLQIQLGVQDIDRRWSAGSCKPAGLRAWPSTPPRSDVPTRLGRMILQILVDLLRATASTSTPSGRAPIGDVGVIVVPVQRRRNPAAAASPPG